ncbi:MAG: hypothetical protein IPJ61_11685 [Tessaracoccus sp.]|uniref:hypothetical protein n=1 Tax=Tessaracoccus sp. TaxID=1971211 RepID=UPI001EB75D86|nr:hypothetical protein [Tessaracoccus sp.]MBK7821702.1 hypothetical protein [Tessaracoccus sp.]
MSTGEPLRPRRGWEPDEGPDDPAASDDTPEPPSDPARRGALPEDAVETGASSDEAPAPQGNPYARPGSDAAREAIPGPVLPISDTPIPAPVFPRSSGEFADSHSPAPRRSALSSTTPVEAEPVAAAAPWFREHRRSLLVWAVGGLVVALVVAVVVSMIVRGNRPTTTPNSQSPTVSTSPSTPPDAVLPSDLLTPEDLGGISTGTWSVTGTTHAAAEHEGRVACFQTHEDDANPTFSAQRTLATSDEEPVAALHRVDAYSSAPVAKAVYEARLAILANCSEVPALLSGADEVTGLAPEASQLTIVFQENKDRYHTVLLTLSGAVVQVLDVTQAGSPVDPESLATALTRSQTQLSERQGEPAPSDVAVKATFLPPADPAGWLVPSDLPRIRAGLGRWNMTPPGPLVSPGMGCENMTLVSTGGPKTRTQATFLMTQDDETPDTFGLDEMRFEFSKEKPADAFAEKLGDALKSCKKRSTGSKVQELEKVTTTTPDGKVTSRLFVINRPITAKESVTYQLIVGQVGTTVTYSLITVDDNYRFSNAQLEALASRTALRAAQG